MYFLGVNGLWAYWLQSMEAMVMWDQYRTTSSVIYTTTKQILYFSTILKKTILVSGNNDFYAHGAGVRIKTLTRVIFPLPRSLSLPCWCCLLPTCLWCTSPPPITHPLGCWNLNLRAFHQQNSDLFKSKFQHIIHVTTDLDKNWAQKSVINQSLFLLIILHGEVHGAAGAGIVIAHVFMFRLQWCCQEWPENQSELILE